MNIKIKRLTTPYDVAWAFERCAAQGDISRLLADDDWLLRAYLSEHSPIREMRFHIECDGISRRAMSHLVRHHVGAQPYIRTQRPDRGGKDGLYDAAFSINAQALIDMAKVRLCMKAHAETRAVLLAIRDELRSIDAALALCLVPKCVYRGGLCGEMQPCGIDARTVMALNYAYYPKLFRRATYEV